MVPPRIVVVPAIPRFPIGKTDQQRLLAVTPLEPACPPMPRGAVHTDAGDGVVTAPIRQAVERAWARTLDRQSLADDTPFDAAGGDSLRLLIFVYHLEEALGTTLPLDLFALAMTPHAVAVAVQRHLSGHELAGGELPQIFLLPGIGGDEPRLARFREACAGALRIVPIDYGDWHDWVRPDFDLGKLLARVTADIVAKAPTGPLILAGYSLGGFMAYAVAARLAEAGRVIRGIGLLDAGNIGAVTGAQASVSARSFSRNDEWQQIIAGFQSGVPGNALARSVVRRLTSPRWQKLLPAATRLINSRLPWDFGYYLRGHLRIGLLTKFIDSHRANFAPRPALATVPLALLRSARRAAGNDDLGWAGYGQSVTVIPVEGDHFNMFDPPHLQALADRFVAVMRPFVQI